MTRFTGSSRTQDSDRPALVARMVSVPSQEYLCSSAAVAAASAVLRDTAWAALNSRRRIETSSDISKTWVATVDSAAIALNSVRLAAKGTKTGYWKRLRAAVTESNVILASDVALLYTVTSPWQRAQLSPRSSIRHGLKMVPV